MSIITEIYGTLLPVLKCSISVIPSQKAYEIMEEVLKRATKLMKKYKTIPSVVNMRMFKMVLTKLIQGNIIDGCEVSLSLLSAIKHSRRDVLAYLHAPKKLQTQKEW